MESERVRGKQKNSKKNCLNESINYLFVAKLTQWARNGVVCVRVRVRSVFTILFGMLVWVRECVCTRVVHDLNAWKQLKWQNYFDVLLGCVVNAIPMFVIALTINAPAI